MAKAIETIEELKAATEIRDAGKVNFATMSDERLMECLFERGIEIPTDDGRLVRKVAIQKLIAWEDNAKPLDSYRKVRCIFQRSGRENEAPYVFLSLNGTAYQVPYDKEVLLPEPVIRACVDLAVQTDLTLTEETDRSGNMRYNEKQIRSVPYTFLGYADEASK